MTKWMPEFKIEPKEPKSLEERLAILQKTNHQYQESNNDLRELSEQQQAEIERLRRELEEARGVFDAADEFRKTIDSPDDLKEKSLRAFVLLQDALLTMKGW